MRKRIGRIRRELANLESSRNTQRKHRASSGVFRVALAGYTNAGKSSLMNALTDSDVLAYDKLFATLDSTTRALETSRIEQGHAHRYRRFYTEASAQPRRGLPFDT